MSSSNDGVIKSAVQVIHILSGNEVRLSILSINIQTVSPSLKIKPDQGYVEQLWQKIFYVVFLLLIPSPLSFSESIDRCQISKFAISFIAIARMSSFNILPRLLTLTRNPNSSFLGAHKISLNRVAKQIVERSLVRVVF